MQVCILYQIVCNCTTFIKDVLKIALKAIFRCVMILILIIDCGKGALHVPYTSQPRVLNLILINLILPWRMAAAIIEPPNTKYT